MFDLYERALLVGLTLQNRIVMAPMSRARAEDEARVPNALMETYYRQRGSAGLVICEATHVSKNSVSRPHSPAIDRDEAIAPWARIPKAVHEQGGKIILQLYHVGRKAALFQMPNNEQPLAPSAIAAKGSVTTAIGKQDYAKPREMTQFDIDTAVEEFKQAAARSVEAGFDGIEIHAGNGYLIDQFIRSSSNMRSDSYGGSEHNRLRFLMDIVDEISAAMPGLRIGVRVTPRDMDDGCRDADTPSIFAKLATALNQRNVAFLHITEGVGKDNQYGITPILRENFDGVLIACGGFDKRSAEEWMTTRQADMIAFGTLFIANPDLPKRLKISAELQVANRDHYRGGGAVGYADYPSL